MHSKSLLMQAGRATAAVANCIGLLTELRPCPPVAAPPGTPVRLHLLMQQLRPPRPLMLLKLFLMMRPPPAFWLTRGPPLGVVADSTNSWLYVPLLHAAAADLAPTALEAWRADPRATDWCTRAPSA